MQTMKVLIRCPILNGVKSVQFCRLFVILLKITFQTLKLKITMVNERKGLIKFSQKLF